MKQMKFSKEVAERIVKEGSNGTYFSVWLYSSDSANDRHYAHNRHVLGEIILAEAERILQKSSKTRKKK